MALLVRFVGLVILLATFAAASASFLYNRAEEADQAARVATQVNMRLRDHVAVLEGVRALYQSDSATSGPGIRAYLGALRPQIQAPGMEGVGIAAAMRAGTPAALEAKLRENYGRDIKVWPATNQPIGFGVVLVEPYTPRRNVALGFDMYSEPTRRAAMRRAWQTGQPAASGIVHLCNADDTTWWDFARAILDEAGYGDLSIDRGRTADLALPAPRPAYSVLDCSHAATLGVALRPWREALAAYLESDDGHALQGAA